MNLGPYGPLSFMLSGFSQLFCTGMCLWLVDPKNSSVVGYLQTPRPFGLGLQRNLNIFVKKNVENPYFLLRMFNLHTLNVYNL